MIISTAIQRMIELSDGNLHDIDHFLKAWAVARTIGELEGLDRHTQEVLELTAVVHDIACPLCREKYGDTNGKHQELESPPLVAAFFEGLSVERPDVERISWLVAHHHTYTNVDGIDHRILLEADLLVNAGENGYSRTMIEGFRERVFRTAAGTRLLDSMVRREPYENKAEKRPAAGAHYRIDGGDRPFRRDMDDRPRRGTAAKYPGGAGGRDRRKHPADR